MKTQSSYQNSWDEKYARQRRRDHANIEAMQNLIIQHITEETGVMMPPKVRAFISALQSAHGGGEVIHKPFSRSHLTIARYLQFTGTEDAREARVRRTLNSLREYQRATGIMLFNVKDGGDLVIAEDGTQTHTATEYTDMLKPIADAAVMRARETEIWRGDKSKGIKAHPGEAMKAQVDWAMSQLVRCEREVEETEEKPVELRKYAATQSGRLKKSANKIADKIKVKGGNGSVWLRELAKDLLREAELMDRPQAAQVPLDGVTNLLPREAENPKKTEENPAKDEESPNMLAALVYASVGIPVFPSHTANAQGVCSCGDGAACKSPGKHPRVVGWQRGGTETQIRAWFQRWSDANIGVPTGAASGWLALDIDPRHGGDASLTALIEEYGDLPATLEAQTGGGGHHIIFEYPQGANIRNSAGKLGEGLDVRGEGGYIIIAPSRHASGQRYHWLTEEKPAPIPDWLLKLLTEEKQPVAGASTIKTRPQAKSSAVIDHFIIEGERNEMLFRHVACPMRGRGASYDEILDYLSEVNASQVSPPLEDRELQKIAASAAKYPPNSAKAVCAGNV